MLYRIENATVYVDAIYHQLQDYENTFADELNHEKENRNGNKIPSGFLFILPEL